MTAALMAFGAFFFVLVGLVLYLAVPFLAQICSDAQADLERRRYEAELIAAGKAVRR